MKSTAILCVVLRYSGAKGTLILGVVRIGIVWDYWTWSEIVHCIAVKGPCHYFDRCAPLDGGAMSDDGCRRIAKPAL